MEIAQIERITSLVERQVALFKQLGGIDERDKIFYKELLRSQFTLPEESREWFVEDRVVAIAGHKPTESDVLSIGYHMASAYRALHGRDPEKRVYGNTHVFTYSDQDLPMLDRTITEYFHNIGQES